LEYDLGTYPAADAWTTIAITLSLTGSQSGASTSISAYVAGVILSTRTVPDGFFEDSPTNTFLLGGSWQTGTLSTSFFGHMYDVKISNTAISSDGLDVSASKVGEGTCGCTTCYNESTDDSQCLSSCDLGEYSATIGGDCLACDASCTNGCITNTHCIPNVDPLCSKTLITGFDVADCLGCTTGAFRGTTTGSLCSCTANSTYDADSHSCVCNANFLATTSNECVSCKNYLKAGEFNTAVTFSSSYLYLTLTFNVEIITTNFSGCSFIKSTTLSTLGLNPTCTWLTGNREVRVTLGSGASIDTGSTFTLDDDSVLTSGTCTGDRIDLIGVVAYNTVRPAPTAVIQMPAEVSLGCA